MILIALVILAICLAFSITALLAAIGALVGAILALLVSIALRLFTGLCEAIIYAVPGWLWAAVFAIGGLYLYFSHAAAGLAGPCCAFSSVG